MTPQFAAGICSLIGAILFFGAGFFFAKHRLTFDQGKFEDEIAQARKREAAVREKSTQETLALRRNIDMLKQKNNAYQKATQKRILELKEQLVGLNSVLGDYKMRLRDLAVEITRADSEKILIVEALDNAKKDLKELEDLKQKNKDLTGKLVYLKSKLSNFSLLKDENKELAAKLAEHTHTKDRKTENPANNNPGAENFAPDKAALAEKRGGLGQTFQSLVNQISRLDGSQTVVVADKLGMLIAGTGDHMESMAATAAIFSEMDSKISSLVTLNDVECVTIKDLDNLTIILQPFSIESENVILSTLTTGKGPNRTLITEFTQQTVTN